MISSIIHWLLFYPHPLTPFKPHSCWCTLWTFLKNSALVRWPHQMGVSNHINPHCAHLVLYWNLFWRRVMNEPISTLKGNYGRRNFFIQTTSISVWRADLASQFLLHTPSSSWENFHLDCCKKNLGSSGPKAAGLKCTWGPNKVERDCVKAQKLLGPSVDIGLNAFANQFAP